LKLEKDTFQGSRSKTENRKKWSRHDKSSHDTFFIQILVSSMGYKYGSSQVKQYTGKQELTMSEGVKLGCFILFFSLQDLNYQQKDS